jgi:large subunit ribosomal protein L24
MNSALLTSGWGRKLAKKLMKTPTKKLKNNNGLKTNRWNIVTGDVVRVMEGPQEGQQGKVLDVIRLQNRIIIDGVNLRKRSIKPTADGTPGKMVTKPVSIHYSNVMLVDPTTGEPTKISRRFLEDGSKVRVSKKSGQIIPKPDPLLSRVPRNIIAGPYDTAPEDVFEVTFDDYELYLPHIYETKRVNNYISDSGHDDDDELD